MSFAVIDEKNRMLWLDRDPEEGFFSIGITTRCGSSSIGLSKNEVLRLYEELKVELQIKEVIPWEYSE